VTSVCRAARACQVPRAQRAVGESAGPMEKLVSRESVACADSADRMATLGTWAGAECPAFGVSWA